LRHTEAADEGKSHVEAEQGLGDPFHRIQHMIGALGLCPLSFVSTFPVVVFLSDTQLAPRVSYDLAIVMLFCFVFVFGYHSGLRPWAAGLSMVAFGGAPYPILFLY
jgi:hypothetical protein